MARKASHSISYRLTKFETIAGWLYLPFYLLILNLLLQLANEKFSLGMTALTMNIVYFAVNLLAVLLIFHGFLRQSFFGGSFWNFVQALVLGFAMYYAGTWVLQFALSRLAPGFTIMESFMDSLAVRSKNGKGTVVTMKRRIALRTARR